MVDALDGRPGGVEEPRRNHRALGLEREERACDCECVEAERERFELRPELREEVEEIGESEENGLMTSSATSRTSTVMRRS